MQLCYNELNGSIPSELGRLKRLTIVALQNNHLSGAIPASLGELETLERLDLSFNTLFGPIPVTLANAPKLQTLDITNNSLSGSVPTGMHSILAYLIDFRFIYDFCSCSYSVFLGLVSVSYFVCIHYC